MRDTAIINLFRVSTLWTVEIAMKLLDQFNSATLRIGWRGFETTAADIGVACNPSIKASCVTAVKFKSQADGKIYTGPLSMFVADRILGRWKQNKFIKKAPAKKALTYKCTKDGYIDGDGVMEYARINGAIIPILESGRQGQMVIANKTEPTTGSTAVELTYAGEIPKVPLSVATH